MRKETDNQKKIVIYGCGEVGNNCYKNLIQNGHIVSYALDKNRSGDHVIEGIHTYKLGNEPKEIDKETLIVIVCLANGLIHKEVADCLYEEGYKYIVFLPMQHCISDRIKMELIRQYNIFLQGDELIKKETVHDYCSFLLPSLDIDNAILRESGKYITVWCGKEILFSESMELWKGDKSKVHIRMEYEDRSILANHPYKLLFDYFDMEIDNADSYFSSKKEKVSADETKRELNEREKLFRVFKNEHNKGMDFFIESAPVAVWNPQNYWNLVGGHHRTLYLLHEKHSLIPIKVENDDFVKWCNKEVYKKTCRFIYENNISTLYAPLPHPGFVNFPSRYENNGTTMLEKVIVFLADKGIESMNSMDCLDDESYFARNMSRIGVTSSIFVNRNKEQLRLAELLNALLYQEIIISENLKCEDFQYDIIFGKEEEKEQLIKLCRRYLFIENNTRDSTNISTKDADYRCLLKEYREGHTHEFGVYIIK